MINQQLHNTKGKMTDSTGNLSYRWPQLLALLDGEDDSATKTVWLMDERQEPLSVGSLLEDAGYQFQQIAHPDWLAWQRANTQLIYINNSSLLTLAEPPEPTQAIWLAKPQFKLIHAWDVWQKRWRNRPVAAASAHWNRLQQAVSVASHLDEAEQNVRLGLAALAMADDDAARQYAEKATESEDVRLQQFVILTLSAPLAMLARKFDSALDLWNQLLKQPDVPERWQAGAAAGLGWAHRERGEYEQAQSAWQQVAQLASDWIQPQLELAQLSMRLGRPDNALAVLQRASSRESTNRNVQSSYGRLLHQLREHEDAIKALKKAVAQPTHP